MTFSWFKAIVVGVLAVMLLLGGLLLFIAVGVAERQPSDGERVRVEATLSRLTEGPPPVPTTARVSQRASTPTPPVVVTPDMITPDAPSVPRSIEHPADFTRLLAEDFFGPSPAGVVGRCPRPEATEAAAVKAAYDDAARQVLPLLHPAARYDGAVAEIAARLQQQSPAWSRHTVRVERPYGDVFFAAVNVHLDDAAVGRLSEEVAGVRAWSIAARVMPWALATAVAGVVVLAGLIADRVTKGYLRWQLRLAAWGMACAAFVLAAVV
ncbi:MAG: hypothetical protein ACFCVE_09050 [Phycisphaerae bacterium]